VKTDRRPTDWNNLQPRAQLTWNVGGRNTDIIKVGGGAFAAMAMYYNLANNMLFDGQQIASIDVTSNPKTPNPDMPAPTSFPTGVIQPRPRAYRRANRTSPPSMPPGPTSRYP
jgi:hypothetical protein